MVYFSSNVPNYIENEGPINRHQQHWIAQITDICISDRITRTSHLHFETSLSDNAWIPESGYHCQNVYHFPCRADCHFHFILPFVSHCALFDTQQFLGPTYKYVIANEFDCDFLYRVLFTRFNQIFRYIYANFNVIQQIKPTFFI